MEESKSYILITPARNEENYLRRTIESVINQTILPIQWIIVSDGSTDSTNQIVAEYLDTYKWLKIIKLPDHKGRDFAAKVHCFNVGYEKIEKEKFDIIGNLDADISFDKDYFEFLLKKFAEIPNLGVAGTPFVEPSLQYNYKFTNIEHVSGACQLFRRECFEDIGGYVPNKRGGIDWIAVTTARMKGWKTKTFTERTCYHHRKIGSGSANNLIAKFRHGEKDYFLGGHPLWQFFRCFYQMSTRPYIIGGLLLLLGYLWAFLRRMERPISRELMKFCRAEQMQRLRKLVLKNIMLEKHK